jgi:hypothetical protein
VGRVVRQLTVLLLPICVTGLPAGCSSGDKSSDSRAKATAPPSRKVPAPAGIAGPRRVEASGAFAAKAVEKVYGREVAPGQPLVIGAACARGRCVVRYRSEARGEGVVVASQDRVLRRLFARRGVRSVTLYVHHWQTGTPTKNEAPVFATTVCRRSKHPSFDWKHIRAADVTRVCRYSHQAGGRLRSQVRRGQLSNKQASRGKGGNGRGNGPPSR